MKSKIIAAVLLASLTLGGCSGVVVDNTPTPTPTPTSCVDGAAGKSAYNLWRDAGNSGSLQEFLDSLVGEPGADGYIGYSGIAGDDGLRGQDGASAYQIWLDAGNEGTAEDFLASLTGSAGVDGLPGLSAYELWISLGNTGTVSDFIDSLGGADGVCTIGDVGPQGPQGEQGAQGIQGPAGPAGEILSPSEINYTMGGGTRGAGATQPTFNGNPQFYGSYVVVGGLVFFNVKVVMTNITSFGTGQYFVTLPFDSKHPYSTSNGRVTDFSSGRNYSLHGSAAAGSNVLELTYSSSSQQLAFDHNSPVSLATTDTFFISGTYIRE